MFITAETVQLILHIKLPKLLVIAFVFCCIFAVSLIHCEAYTIIMQSVSQWWLAESQSVMETNTTRSSATAEKQRVSCPHGGG